MKPNFNEMTAPNFLRQEHRDDDEAWGIFWIDVADETATWYPPPDEVSELWKKRFARRFKR